MADESLDLFPGQLTGEDHRVPVLLVEMIASHDGFVLFAEKDGKLWVTLETHVYRCLVLGYKRKHFSLRRSSRITNFIHRNTLAKRIVQKTIWHTQDVCFDVFMIHVDP